MGAVNFRLVLVIVLLLASFSKTLARPVTAFYVLALRDTGDVVGDGLSMSPNGRYVIYNVHQASKDTNGYFSWWTLVNTTTSVERRIIADGGEPIWDYVGQWTAYSPIWSPDSSSFYYIKRTEGVNRLRHVVLSSADTAISDSIVSTPNGRLTSLTRQNASQADLTIEAPTPATTRAAQTQLRTGMLLSFGYRSDLRGERVGKYDPLKGPPDYTPSDIPTDYALNLRTGQIAPQKVAAIMHYNEDEIPVVKDLRDRYMFTASPNSKRLAFDAEIAPASRLGQVRYAVYVSPLAGGTPRQFSPLSSFPIRQIAWSADGKQLYYLRSTDYMNSDMFIGDPGAKFARRLTHSGVLLDGCSFASELPLAACTTESPTRPRNVAVINLTTGAIKRVSDLNPQFDRLDKTKGELMVRTNKDGDTTFGYLTYPRGYRAGHRYPLIITLYRARGFQRGGVGDEYPIDVFAANGFFVLAYDVYNTGSYMPIALSQRQPLSITVMDDRSPLDGITQMVDELIGRGMVDRSRVGIGGLSHGTSVTLYAISHSHLFRAAICDGGSWDPIDYYFKDDLGTMLFTSWGLNGPPYSVNYDKWKIMAPSLSAANITAPLLINAPDSEYLSGLPQYWEMRDHGKPVEMYIFPHETHVKMEPVHRLVIYNRNLDWYKYWLLNERDPDPAKRDQYRRWDQLRSQLAAEKPG